MPLYPLKFLPLYVPKIWGGAKIERILGRKVTPGKVIGESWEIYDLPPGVVEGVSEWISSVVANGPLAGRTLRELLHEFGRELHGDVPLLPDDQFPLLVKYLDAGADLSVQVHPDEEYCRKHPEAHLKNEAWYIIHADSSAKLYKGIKPGVTREQFRAAIENGTVEQLLCAIPVKNDQCMYLPSGTVHSLCTGILAAEIQTPSDTTFRIYDYGRIDPSTGKPRKLHVEQALECIDFTHTPEPPQPRSHVAGLFTTITRLVANPYFIMEKVRFIEGVEETIPYDQPVVWMMLKGEARITVRDMGEPTLISGGDTVLLPAKMNQPVIKTVKDCVWLEITFPF